ncbi:unnamed protein product, partial [Mesorhabditis spiculigera]
MEAILHRHLGYEKVDPAGHSGGGSISRGEAYDTEFGRVFAKHNAKRGSFEMFEGEYAGLAAIAATGAICCPKPIKVIDLGENGACLVTDYVDMGGRSRGLVQKFGKQLAEMHNHNAKLLKEAEQRENFVGSGQEGQPRFGFEKTTCCGALPLRNEFMASWPEFYVQNRLDPQVQRILEKNGDRALKNIYPELLHACEKLFSDYEAVPPALVHGDLWSGNWSSTAEGEPVIFDPAAFYGDPEFEEGIMNMFGGFGKEFWSAYHEILPSKPGRDKRVLLYELFHNLNHW